MPLKAARSLASAETVLPSVQVAQQDRQGLVGIQTCGVVAEVDVGRRPLVRFDDVMRSIDAVHATSARS